MFKKLTLLVLIALLVLPALTACSSEADEGIIPPVVAADEINPTESDPVQNPTPETTPNIVKDQEKPIPVPEFIAQAESGKYERGDPVLISGIVELLGSRGGTVLTKSEPAYILLLGPETNRLFVIIYFDEPVKLKVGNKIVVEGVFGAVTGDNVQVGGRAIR